MNTDTSVPVVETTSNEVLPDQLNPSTETHSPYKVCRTCSTRKPLDQFGSTRPIDQMVYKSKKARGEKEYLTCQSCRVNILDYLHNRKHGVTTRKKPVLKPMKLTKFDVIRMCIQERNMPDLEAEIDRRLRLSSHATIFNLTTTTS